MCFINKYCIVLYWLLPIIKRSRKKKLGLSKLNINKKSLKAVKKLILSFDKGCIELFKGDSEEIYNVIFQIITFFWTLYSSKILNNKCMKTQKYEAALLLFTLIIRNVSWAANQYIWMNNDAEIQLCITGMNYISKYITIENNHFKL